MSKTTAIITGGASGIGLASVRILSNQFDRVIVLDLKNSQALKETNADFKACDLSEPEQIKSCFQSILSDYSEINCLVNNAGMLTYGSVSELSIEDWDKLMNVNLKAPFLCAKYAIPAMSKGSVIINVASIQSFHAQPKVAAYASSKAALLGLTRSIAIDYSGKIRCVAVCPGTIDTPMLHDAVKQSEHPQAMMDEINASHLTGRVGSAEEVAELISFLCSEKCQFINGGAIRVDGGLGVNLGGSIE